MENFIEKVAKKSKTAFRQLSTSKVKQRNLAILNISKLIQENTTAIIEANKLDIIKAKKKNSQSLFLID